MITCTTCRGILNYFKHLLKPLGNVPKHHMLSVQMGGTFAGDEELAAIGA